MNRHQISAIIKTIIYLSLFFSMTSAGLAQTTPIIPDVIPQNSCAAGTRWDARVKTCISTPSFGPACINGTKTGNKCVCSGRFKLIKKPNFRNTYECIKIKAKICARGTYPSRGKCLRCPQKGKVVNNRPPVIGGIIAKFCR